VEIHISAHEGPPLTSADIKVAAYQEAIDICHAEGLRYGDMPRAAIIAIVHKLEQRIKEAING
jgi:hypothetical protein